ncbi:MAG: NAD(P)-dependent dehydrogenase (short-subunit alcohol dehydrogenase family), partial [Flavobacteriaceae bacterium]
GANSGIGFETSKVLAEKNAKVILAVRNQDKGRQAMEKILKKFPEAELELRILDLANFDSIKAFAKGILKDYSKLDVLINNAGVMMVPESKTVQGFESHFGINFLGPFLLTALLIDLIENTPNSRVVNTSSLAHLSGRINFSNLKSESSYKSLREYNQSKLADLIFSIELQERLSAAGMQAKSTAAHPGLTKTAINRHNSLMSILSNVFTQNVAMGVLPTLRAAIDPILKGGEYIGPANMFETFGYPEIGLSSELAKDKQLAGKLWAYAEEACDIQFLSKEL